MKFIVKTRGTADDDWQQHTIESESADTIVATVDQTFGIARDEQGKQTNADMIKVEIIGPA